MGGVSTATAVLGIYYQIYRPPGGGCAEVGR